MDWPQITYIALIASGLTKALILHGQPQKPKHNFWASLIASAILIFILYSGGFFS
jgi:hypothetical protein